MERTVMVKSEVQANGDIFLYYVDENGVPIETADGTITTIVEDQLQQLQENYILEEIPIVHEADENYQDVQEIVPNQVRIEENTEEESPKESFKEKWSDQEIKKLLVFYIDNKTAFLTGSFTKRHLWTVACQMTLTNKNAASCQLQLRNLKKEYENLQLEYIKNNTDPRGWPYYELCHKAFHDSIDMSKLEANHKPDRAQNVVAQSFILSDVNTKEKEGDIYVLKKVKKIPDKKVKQMLEMYYQYRNSSKNIGAQKAIWQKIAEEVGETPEYIHKKFLNYKRHYICMVEKRNNGGVVDWPYMALFDAIFNDDVDFQRKYGLPKPVAQTSTNKTKPATTNKAKPLFAQTTTNNPKPIIAQTTSNNAKLLFTQTTTNNAMPATLQTSTNYATKTISIRNSTNVVVPVSVSIPISHEPIDWNDTEKTVLVKYYYDCFEEFQDPTIPKAFLWNEVGRLLAIKPEDCKKKYEDLKSEHLSQYIKKEYNIQTRKPLAIMFDNIISQEVNAKFFDPAYLAIVTDLRWKTGKIDELVQFMFDNIELFKDQICHFVCWAAVAEKLSETVKACIDVWNDLTSLYKSILEDKKEEPDMQIDWRYIEIFDKIFDYGLDTKLLEGYENKINYPLTRQKKVVLGKKTRGDDTTEALSDVEAADIDEDSNDNQADPKAVQILEYYLKYKDKFTGTQKKKNKLWAVLGEEIDMSAEECAAKFKSLKKKYMAHIQREINNPVLPVLWPYYTLCKKVFGYRAIRTKLKNNTKYIDGDEWVAKEIKMLINFASQNLADIEADLNSTAIWEQFSKQVCKSDHACREMFLQLRKSYRQVKKMMTEHPECKVTWKYFKLFKDIYNDVPEDMQVDTEELKGDEEYQCIVVIPEGQELTDLNAKKVDKFKEKPISRWSVKHKRELLIAIYNHLKAHEGKVMDTKETWEEIAKKLQRRPFACRKIYVNLKREYRKNKSDDTKPLYFSWMEKILKLKPKFVRPPFTDEDVILKEQDTYTDVVTPLWCLEKALNYYLEHVEEFVNPKYDKKQAWISLAKDASLKVSRIFRKINYLKQFYNKETNEVAGKPFEFGNTLKEILEKELICKIALGDVTDPLSSKENTDAVIWTDDEVEQLLLWYLENLEMFKNPKYNQNYLWLEVPNFLNKSPLACSRKMAEIRSVYSSMVKENPSALNDWKYYELCQKIYGTGKRVTEE